MGERLASWLVLSLSTFPILSPYHNLFCSWAFKDSYLLLQVTVLTFLISVTLIHMLGRSITFLSPTSSLHWALFYFLTGFTLLRLLFSPSLVFSIPTSSDLRTFTKIQETHKGIWVLSLKKKSVQACHILHHTHTEDSSHRLSKNVHHLISTIPSGFRQPSLLK